MSWESGNGDHPETSIRVLIASDKPVVRAGLRAMLEADAGIRVVGETGRSDAAVNTAVQLDANVAVLDARIGLLAVRQLASSLSVLVVGAETDERVHDVLAAGALGFVSAFDLPDRLLAAVRAVAVGGMFINPLAARRLTEELARHRRSSGRFRDALALLTARERDVLRQLAGGLSNREIARALGVAETTVRTHLAHISRKLGLRDRVQAAVFAYESGLVSADV